MKEKIKKILKISLEILLTICTACLQLTIVTSMLIASIVVSESIYNVYKEEINEFIENNTEWTLTSNNEPKKANNERATTTELQGATTLVDFNTWTKNQLGGVEIYSPSCARIYSDGGSTWSYLWHTFTFDADTYVNYNFHVIPQNSNLRTGIRIFNPSTGTDYVNITETLSGPKTYQGTLKINSQEQIRFDLRRNFYGTGISGSCVWSGFIAYSDYGAGYENGYDNGYDAGEQNGEQFGYTNGFDAGKNNVINNPNNYNLYTQQQYNDNYTSGLNSGYEQGFEEGQDDILWNPNDYNLYTQEQYNQNYHNGYSTGYDAGEQNGEQFGYSTGFEEGKEEGLEQGYDAGHTQGYREGFEEGSYQGYDAGYELGFEEGKEEGLETSNSFWHLLENATQTMHNFFSIEIIPGLTLATIIGVFIGLPLLIFFLKLISAK